MRFAVIGDIHGNIFALKSVLEDIEMQAVDFIISTGDLVGYMPFVNEVIQMVKDKKVLVIQGNHDQVIGEGEKVTDEQIVSLPYEVIQKDASRIFTNWKISEENRRYLKNLPQKLQLECNNKKLVIVHGSPRNNEEYLFENEECLAPLAKESEWDVVICGHTHIPYQKEVNKTLFINAGSVGKPKHGDNRSSYVIVELKEGNIEVQIQYVPYNVAAMIEAIKGNQMISDELIGNIQ